MKKYPQEYFTRGMMRKPQWRNDEEASMDYNNVLEIKKTGIQLKIKNVNESFDNFIHIFVS